MTLPTIDIRGQHFTLHASGAIYWHELDRVLIADVHLGKINHFRKHGSAVPHQAIAKNFELLDEVIIHFRPGSITFLGDLFHSDLNTEWHIFDNWIKQHDDVSFLLVKGNHDIIPEQHYIDLGMDVVEEQIIDNILLCHHPVERELLFYIAGHIHPGVRLRGLGHQRLSVPCFCVSSHGLLLPAFGVFTGKYIIDPNQYQEIYAIADDQVVLIT